jgi:hypothetical protein
MISGLWSFIVTTGTRRIVSFRLHCIVAACLCLPVTTISGTAEAGIGQAQKSGGAVQTGPIDEPRSAEEKPSGPPAPKGIHAITRKTSKCNTMLSIPADSLFKPEHWTFKPDAGETMDVLGPMITEAGKHPVRIQTFVGGGDSDSDSQMLADKRAITVRGWLINHGYVPEGTPLTGESTPSLLTSGDKPTKRTGDGVRIVIDTCK